MTPQDDILRIQQLLEILLSIRIVISTSFSADELRLSYSLKDSRLDFPIADGDGVKSLTEVLRLIAVDLDEYEKQVPFDTIEEDEEIPEFTPDWLG